MVSKQFCTMALAAGFMTLPGVVLADDVTCGVALDALVFDQVDAMLPGATTNQSQINLTCRNDGVQPRYAQACLGLGRQGARSMSPLQFEIYQDAARSQVFGTQAAGQALKFSEFLVPAGGSVTRSAAVFGKVFGGQTTVPPGAYMFDFSAADVQLTGAAGSAPGNNCDTPNIAPTNSTFKVLASVLKTCSVTAQDLLFGTRQATDREIKGSSQNSIVVKCSMSTSYSVGLTPHSTSSESGQGELATTDSPEKIPYGLFSDAGYSKPWGNLVNINTVGGVGTGAAQAGLSVYGKVPGANVTPGVYKDLVTVSVTY